MNAAYRFIPMGGAGTQLVQLSSIDGKIISSVQASSLEMGNYLRLLEIFVLKAKVQNMWYLQFTAIARRKIPAPILSILQETMIAEAEMIKYPCPWLR